MYTMHAIVSTKTPLLTLMLVRTWYEECLPIMFTIELFKEKEKENLHFGLV